MSRFEWRLWGLTCAMTFVGILSACGGSDDNRSIGGSGSAPPIIDLPPPEPVRGIATPSNVSVVTATNAD